MNIAKPVKNSQSTTTLTTTNFFISQNGTKDTKDAAFTVTTNSDEEFMDCYGNSFSPECPNSPNVTMAGSPRGIFLY